MMNTAVVQITISTAMIKTVIGQFERSSHGFFLIANEIIIDDIIKAIINAIILIILNVSVLNKINKIYLIVDII